MVGKEDNPASFPVPGGNLGGNFSGALALKLLGGIDKLGSFFHQGGQVFFFWGDSNYICPVDFQAKIVSPI